MFYTTLWKAYNNCIGCGELDFCEINLSTKKINTKQVYNLYSASQKHMRAGLQDLSPINLHCLAETLVV